MADCCCCAREAAVADAGRETAREGPAEAAVEASPPPKRPPGVGIGRKGDADFGRKEAALGMPPVAANAPGPLRTDGPALSCCCCGCALCGRGALLACSDAISVSQVPISKRRGW
jgi:hypothetical protein